MSVRTIEGVVEGGQVRLPDEVELPENAVVYVVIPDIEPTRRLHIYSPRLAHPEDAAFFVKEMIVEESDAEV